VILALVLLRQHFFLRSHPNQSLHRTFFKRRIKKSTNSGCLVSFRHISHFAISFNMHQSLVTFDRPILLQVDEHWNSGTVNRVNALRRKEEQHCGTNYTILLTKSDRWHTMGYDKSAPLTRHYRWRKYRANFRSVLSDKTIFVIGIAFGLMVQVCGFLRG
jgi:hypothetical protein